MSDVEKIILKMKRQPNGIRFDELNKVLKYNGYIMKTKKGTSHRNFINSKGDVTTIKEENPLKAVYVKDTLKRIGEYNN
jgi:predicted RNA binding protein YcfA (HicA-like mRNA interferase family)